MNVYLQRTQACWFRVRRVATSIVRTPNLHWGDGGKQTVASYDRRLVYSIAVHRRNALRVESMFMLPSRRDATAAVCYAPRYAPVPLLLVVYYASLQLSTAAAKAAYQVGQVRPSPIII